MKKTVSVNIKGINFLIEEDAYELLGSYLKRLENSLKNEKGSKEIIEDIEYRISELCSQSLKSSKEVVELTDIERILSTLGQPEDFVEDSSDLGQEEKTTTENVVYHSETRKRLFRDVENSKIAGVCSGLAGYFNIDVLFVRAFFLLIFFFGGFSIPLYIILWIVTPKISSSVDRLRMQGKPITIDTVKEEVESAAGRFKDESKSFANKLRQDGEYADRFKSLTSIIRVASGIFFYFVGLMTLISVVVFGFFDKQFIPFNFNKTTDISIHNGHVNTHFQTFNFDSNFLSFSDLNSLFIESSSDLFWMKTAALVIGLSVVLFCFVLGTRLVFNFKNKWYKILLGILFSTGCIATIVCVYFGMKSGSQLAIEGEVERKVADIYTPELVIQSGVDAQLKNNGFVVKSSGFDGFISIKGNRIQNADIDLVYRMSKDTLYHVYQSFSAHALTHKLAVEKAKHIRHSLVVKDSLVTIDTDYSYPKEDKLRLQKVTIIIEVPKGKHVRLANHLVSFDTEVDDEIVDDPYYEEEGTLYKNGTYDHWD